jgi:hypothetical protein
MVGGTCSATQGPENLQNRSHPRQRPSLMIGRIIWRQPVSDANERLVEKRRTRLGVIQSLGPTAECGGIGHTVGVSKRRSRFFPRTMLHKAVLQCLTARQQTVVCVRKGKEREEGEGLPATGAATSPDANPVVVCIVCLLAPASVADDQIASTNRASPQDHLATARGPIRFELVRQDAKWDKQNRRSLELCLWLDLPRSRPEAELLPPEAKSNWERIPLLGSLLRVV